MIPQRVEQAKKILREINKPAFISGSFLFKEKYNDIDIFIIDKKRKQYQKGNKDYIHITQKNLKQPLFCGAFLYSVANFDKSITPEIKRPEYGDIIFLYQVAIKEIIDKEDLKARKELIGKHYLFVNDKLLNSYEISKEFDKLDCMEDEKQIQSINNMIKELILQLYSKKYMYNLLGSEIKSFEDIIRSYKTHNNVVIYKKTLQEIRNECRRAKT